MYLVRTRQAGEPFLVFAEADPRADGCPDPVAEGVSLDNDPARVHAHGFGEAQPAVCVGRSPDDPAQYKVFRDRSEQTAAGFELVSGTPVCVRRWTEFVAACGPRT